MATGSILTAVGGGRAFFVVDQGQYRTTLLFLCGKRCRSSDDVSMMLFAR